jgi:phage terminase large subunit GpA-like protein
MRFAQHKRPKHRLPVFFVIRIYSVPSPLPHSRSRDGALVLFAALAAVARPEPEIRPSEWAAKHRIVSPESQSPFPGPWMNERAPYLVEPMDACEIGNGIRRVVLTGGAQFGKSDAVLNSIFHACDTSPRPYLVLLPSINEVNAYSSLKWDPNVKDTPRLARVVCRKTIPSASPPNSNPSSSSFRPPKARTP